jgi:hypothetical protein
MEYDALLTELSAALTRGDVEPGDVEKLLRRGRAASRRADVPSVLRAAGALVCFAGAALLYGIGFHSYPVFVQEVTPFLFPAVALGATVLMHRALRPAWEVELAGMVGYVALGAATVTSAVVTGAGPGAGIVASLAITAVVLALHAAVRIVRLTGWGLSASLVAFTGCAADAAGILNGATVPWWLGLQGVVAVAAGALLLHRSHAGAESAWRSAGVLAVAAAVAGMADASFGHLGPWHVLLTAAVAACLLGAARFDMGGLMWVGALSSIVWLGTLAVVVGRSGNWAVAVILFGLGLVGVAPVIARRRGPGRDEAGVIVGLR